MSYNCVYICATRRFFPVLNYSSDRDSEKLPLRYIVKRTRFYVSWKFEKKNIDDLFGEKIIPLKSIHIDIAERTALTALLLWQRRRRLNSANETEN